MADGLATQDTGRPAAPWLLRVLELLLFAIVVFWLVRLVMGLLAPSSLIEPSDRMTLNMTTSSLAASPVAPSLSFDPFYRDAVVAAGAGPVDNSDAPETGLDLVLFGLTSGETGSAIIQTPDGRQASYRVGAEIMPGVTLVSSHPTYVVISRNGVRERLSFADKTSTFGVVQPEPASPNMTAVSNPGVDVDIAESLLNPEDLLSDISLERATRDGQVMGYEVRDRGTSGALKQLGLNNGDIITRIGETDLTQGRPEFQNIFQNIQSGAVLRIEFIRDGTSRSIEVVL